MKSATFSSPERKSAHCSPDDFHRSLTLMCPCELTSLDYRTRQDYSFFGQRFALFGQIGTTTCRLLGTKAQGAGVLTSLFEASCRTSARSVPALLHRKSGSQAVFNEVSGTLPSSTTGLVNSPRYAYILGISIAMSSANSNTSFKLQRKRICSRIARSRDLHQTICVSKRSRLTL